MRKEIPLIITFVFGAIMVIDYLVPHRSVTAVGSTLQGWTIIITAFAYVLGIANVVRINLQKISSRSADWPYAFPLLVGLAGMVGIGLIGGIHDGTLGYQIFLHIYTPMQATMFSLLAFFIASAAFRAFRIRSVDAGLLAIAALFVMIGRVPIGDEISRLLHLPESVDFASVQSWIMNVPNLAAKRAILIGAALGAISTGLKIILGLERNYLGE
jgi:hypothetical protein